MYVSRIRKHLNELIRSQNIVQSPERVEEIARHILNKIGTRMPLGQQTLHRGNLLIRIRANPNRFGSFNHRNELSYKPQRFNTTYQRASTPDQTMFYAALMQLEAPVIPNRATSTLEGIAWLREPHSSGKQKVTYSKWIVKEDIYLFPVIFNPEFTHNQAVKANTEFTPELIKEKVPEWAPEILEFYNLVSKEFGTPYLNSNEHHYFITSIFSKIFLEKGSGKFDGILYPSCRVYGDGTNVAILPEAADTKLDLIAAGESMIYKHDQLTIVANLTISSVYDKDPLTDIIYVPSDNVREEEDIYRELGVTYLDFRE